MKELPTPPDPHSPLPDPDDLLASRLRRTTPAFEARFLEMRRRLAHEPATPWWYRFLPVPARTLVVGLASLVLVALVTFRLLPVSPSTPSLAGQDIAAYLEMAALDASLTHALVLTDPETLDAILHMPLQ